MDRAFVDYPDYPSKSPDYPQITYKDSDTFRLNKEERKQGDKRSDFEIDRSRIIHSSAFRRLQGKTQVYTPEAGDFHRTRLTHSLEVAQIAKGLAIQLGAEPSLAEAISLAHDLGHPPFGHSGEEVLSERMLPFGGFEQNAQSFRIVTQLETKFPEHVEVGLNLTRATLDGILKYKTPFSRKRFEGLPAYKRKFYYAEDIELVKTACGGSLISDQSFDCQIMDWADDIAYAVHDVEDAIHFGFITRSTLDDRTLSDSVLSRARKELKHKNLRLSNLDREWERLRISIKKSMPDNIPHPERRARRKDLTSRLITHLILNVQRHERLNPWLSSESDRYIYELYIPPKLRVCQALLTSLVWECVIESRPGYTLRYKSEQLLNDLWNAFVEVDKKGNPKSVRKKLLPGDWLGNLSCEKDLQAQLRIVTDFMAGMTDEYARRVHAWLYERDVGWHPDQLP